ncbi:MAG: hypothetical protein CMP76_15725 [Flavobacterium sp.]|uniref:DUF2891 domain-containing protein n=1 Tax=Flavobacterium sp. TaxID=239 RepID=UPI000C42ECCC|nr:DUF2891 domain-containing protein [Flavobacterium sp.]MBF04731.1 hypothetical protein [Flavobacterium sp.]|tara:strand:- start:979 stop:2037 length:1059 start_codon:yes stop_codon:yes gene_type:complete
MKYFLFFIFGLNQFFAQELTLEQANHLASLPIKCLEQEYPNKLNQLLKDKSELASPKTLHPAFYGCFDWHSSVHGHWSLVYLLNNFNNLEDREVIIQKLQTNLSKENIEQEMLYFAKPHEKSFERTYGWNWLLKLQLELEQSKEPFVKPLSENLKPLTDVLIDRYIEFLPKLLYPIRVGTHSNTAFGLTNAWDYAVFSKNEAFQKVIKENALRMYGSDENCPFTWEPSGTDFLSPCMEEIGLMQRILSEKEFLPWLEKFTPHLCKKSFEWETAKVSDRTDGHLVHLDGLNFSRAWNLYALIKQYPKKFSYLKKIADAHLQFSLPSVVDGNYEGEHWLASFALRAFEEKKNIK